MLKLSHTLTSLAILTLLTFQLLFYLCLQKANVLESHWDTYLPVVIVLLRIFHRVCGTQLIITFESVWWFFFITLLKNHEEIECQNTVKGKMHRVLRLQATRQRAFYLMCICSLDSFWTLFQASCVKFYIQFIRHVYPCWIAKHPFPVPWIWKWSYALFPCFFRYNPYNVPDNLFYLEKILENSCPVNI